MTRPTPIRLLACLPLIVAAQQPQHSDVWSPDNGGGTYTNPVLYADYYYLEALLRYRRMVNSICTK